LVVDSISASHSSSRIFHTFGVVDTGDYSCIVVVDLCVLLIIDLVFTIRFGYRDPSLLLLDLSLSVQSRNV